MFYVYINWLHLVHGQLLTFFAQTNFTSQIWTFIFLFFRRLKQSVCVFDLVISSQLIVN